MTIYQKLLIIQSELKVPKSQVNKFGNYNYRNCEDILEALKPLCLKHQTVTYLTDDVVVIGDRTYVKATATLVDIEKGEKISNTAFAREEESKKGMDGSQVTGASSSYARKYALNGLFGIDDTKDSDSTNTGDAPKPQTAKPPICSKCGAEIKGVKKDGKQYTPEETSRNLGGLCVKCYKEQKNAVPQG